MLTWSTVERTRSFINFTEWMSEVLSSNVTEGLLKRKEFPLTRLARNTLKTPGGPHFPNSHQQNHSASLGVSSPSLHGVTQPITAQTPQALWLEWTVLCPTGRCPPAGAKLRARSVTLRPLLGRSSSAALGWRGLLLWLQPQLRAF